MDVIVIGAGVVGLSSALALQSRGLSVTVLDRTGPAAGASAGNAGAFAFTDILPLASPGILRKAPKWLMDLSKAELEPFLNATGTAHMLRRDGNLQVYESQAEFDASLLGWQARAEHGIEFRHLTADAMADLQPGLSPRFTHGTFTPGWFSIDDPRLYTLALAERFVANGGILQRAEVKTITATPDGVEVDTLHARHVVIAAGAHSHLLAPDTLPLETERGYNTTLPPGAFDLRRQITFGGHGFVISRLSTGIRVGGAVELGGLTLPPNYKRAEAMLQKAATFLPGLRTTGGTQWMGFRPSMPDSLPVIGHSRASRHIVYAFGHGHLGLTQAAGTARLVADLVTDAAPAIDLKPFSAHRF